MIPAEGRVQEEGRFGAVEEFWNVIVGIVLGMLELPGVARRKGPDGTESEVTEHSR